jgi:eukaryotic-like serine/threonine-protein kinase
LKKLGKYEVLGELGHGAMGIVYRARDPVINRLVALKTITTGLAEDPNLLQRFYREAQSAGGLQHPNIVTIYDMGDEQNLPYIAMELIEGESLEQIISRRTELPVVLKLTYAIQACRAFDYAHKRGIVHRDIKPGNMMVNKEGVLKVVDFGIARVLDTSKTQTGMLIGTFAYMSPEQYHGEHADERSDIWSFGVLLYELLCYQRPFTGENPGSLMHSICQQEHRPLREFVSDCPQEMEFILSKILRKSPQDRCQSMEDLLLELDPVYKKLQSRSVAELVNRSRQLVHGQAFAEARDLLREALKVDSANTQARTLLERVNAELKRVLIRPRTLQYVEKGSALLEEGRIQEARTEAENALQLDSSFEPAQELQKRVQHELDRAQVVAEWLQSCRQRLAEGVPDEAEALLGKVLEIDPSNKEAIVLQQAAQTEKAERLKRLRLLERMQEARGLWTQQNYEGAIDLLTALQKEYPGEEEIQRLLETVQEDHAEQFRQNTLGQVRDLLAGGSYVECGALLVELQRRFPNDDQISQLIDDVKAGEAKQRRVERLSAVRGCLAGGRYQESMTLLKSLEQEFPNDEEIARLFKRGQDEQAEQQRQQGVASARNLLASRRYEECNALLDKLGKQFPDDQEISGLLSAVREDEADQRKLESLSEARRLLAERRYEKSIVLLVTLEKEFPHDDEIPRLLKNAREDQAEQQRQQGVAKARTLLAARRYEECNTLLGKLGNQFPDDDEIPELLNAVREDEAQQRKLKGLGEAQNLIAARRYEESIALLTALQEAFPNEAEIPKLLTNAGKEQVEQQKQQKLAECRALLAAQKFKAALDLLGTLRAAHPKDSVIQKLCAVAEREADKQAREERLQVEITDLKKLVSQKKYSDILSRAEILQGEFPGDADLLRLVDFARSQQSQIETETRLRSVIDEAKAHFKANRFSEAIKTATAGLKAFPENPELIHLREQAEPEEKKQRNRGLIERQIREIKFRINRQDFSDAVDLAEKTLAIAGPHAELTQLLHSALLELQTRDKKRGQEYKIQQIQTLLHSGNIDGAAKTLQEALAAETLDGFDMRVSRMSQEIEGAKTKPILGSSPTPSTSPGFSKEYAFMRGAPAEIEPPTAENPGAGENPVSQASSSATVSAPRPVVPMPPPQTASEPPPSHPSAETPPVVSPPNSASPPKVLPRPAELPKPVTASMAPVVNRQYQAGPADIATSPIPPAPQAIFRKPTVVGALAGVLIVAIWAGMHFYYPNKPQPSANTSRVNEQPTTPKAPAPRTRVIDPEEQLQRTAIDTSDKLIASGDLTAALQALQDAEKLKGPLTPEIKVKEATVSESLNNEALAKLRQQEAALWQRAMDELQRSDFASATLDFRKIVGFGNSGVRKADAQKMLDEEIPKRKKEEALFGQATRSAHASDAQSLQRASDLFGQVVALDGPRRTEAAEYQGNLAARLNKLKQENLSRQIALLDAAARQNIKQGELAAAREKADQIRQAGGNPTSLSGEIEQAQANQTRTAQQQKEFQEATQMYVAVGSRDKSGLEKSRGDFQAIVRENGPQAGDAQQYVTEIDKKLDALNTPPPSPPVMAKKELPSTTPADEVAIRDVVQKFFQAFDQRSADALRQVWPGMPQKRYDIYKNSFESMNSISIQIVNESVKINPAGVTAIVSIESQEEETPKTEKKPRRFTPAWTFQLAKRNGVWAITDFQ